MRLVPPLPKWKPPRLMWGWQLLELCAAGAGLLYGAALIGLWMVGIVLMLLGAGLGADALLRDNDNKASRKPRVGHTHEDIMERYRRVR